MFKPSSIVSISAWHALRRRKWIKVIAVVIILTFLFPYITWAFQPGNFQINLRAIVFNQQSVIIPKKIGSVNHAHQGDERLVVHIQDLHCNYEVQKNIAGLIHLLAEKHGLRLVSIEGASLPIDPSKIRTFPIATIREEVSDYFVRQGKLSGAEYYAATGKYPVLLEGIENAEHYARNKRSVEFILKDESQGYCHDLRDILAAVKPAVYNSRLLEFDQKSTAYGEGKTGVLQHCLFLRKIARKLNHKLSDYPNFTVYADSKQKIFAPGIEVDELFAEIDRLDYAVREYFYTETAQRRLDQHLRRVSIMEKLLNISANPEELLEFRENRENFRVQAFVGFVRAQDFAGEFEIDPEIFALDDFLNAAADFYSVADERGDYFVANTLAKMRRHNEKIAVLVTGGYHTQHVLSALHTEGLSILSVKPRITHQDLVNPYFSLLRNRKTPLEKLLSQEQKIFAPEPYLPKLFAPDKSPNQAAGSNKRERLFARLLRLLFAAKTVAYCFFTKKSEKKLPAAIDQKLKKYWAQNGEFMPAEKEVTRYPNGVISFAMPPENNQKLLAVVWPSKQAAPLEVKDALRIMNFKDVNIAIVSTDKLDSVQAQLESASVRQTAWAWIMSTFNRIRDGTRAFGRRFRESVSILAAAIQHNPAVSLIFADIIFLVLLPMYFFNSSGPSDLGWMTMALPFTNQLQAPNRFFPAWAPGLSPSADQILNKLDQPIPGHGKQVRWINKKRVLQEIKKVPLIERTDERILKIVLRHIRWKGAPILAKWEQAFILEKGIDSFIDRIKIWDFFRAQDIEAGHVTGRLIMRIFAANRPNERLTACLRLFKSPPKSRQITGQAAAEIYNSSRTLEEMSLFIPALFDIWSCQLIVQLVLKSRLDQHEIKECFINKKTRIRTIRNAKECSQYIRDILARRQAGEKVRRDAGLIIQELREAELLASGREKEIVVRFQGSEVFSEKDMLCLILRNLNVRSDKSPALNQAGINLIAKQNNLKTLRKKIGLLSELYNMRDREGRFLEQPLLAAAMVNGRKNEDNIKIITEHLQKLKNYALMIILRGKRLPEEVARIVRALREAQFSDTAIAQVFELNTKERRIHILLPLIQHLLPGPIRQKQFISLLTYKTTPYEVLSFIKEQSFKWPDIISVLAATLTQKQREEASLEYLAALLAAQDESGRGPDYNECIQLLQTVSTSEGRQKLREQLWTLYDYPLAKSSQANLSIFAGLPEGFQNNLPGLLLKSYLTPTAYADFQKTVAFNLRLADQLQRVGRDYAALAKEADPSLLEHEIFDQLTQRGHTPEVIERVMRQHDRFSLENVDPALIEIITALDRDQWLDASQFWRNVSAESWQERTDERLFQMALEHIRYESRILFTDHEIKILVTKGFGSFHNKLKLWTILRQIGEEKYINSFLISRLLMSNHSVVFIKQQLAFYGQYQMAGSTAGHIASSNRPVSEWEEWYPQLLSVWGSQPYVAQQVLLSPLSTEKISFRFIDPRTRVLAIKNMRHFKEIIAGIKKEQDKRQLGIERERLLNSVKRLQAGNLINEARAKELIALCQNVSAPDLPHIAIDIVASITRQGIPWLEASDFTIFAKKLSPGKLERSLELLKFLRDFRFPDGTPLLKTIVIRILFSSREEEETRYLLRKYQNLTNQTLLLAMFGKRPIPEVEDMISRLDFLKIKPSNQADIIASRKNLARSRRLINYVARVGQKTRGTVLRNVFKRSLTPAQLMNVIRANLYTGARLQREQLAELIREGMSRHEIQALRLYFRELLQRQAVMPALTSQAARSAERHINFRLLMRGIDTTTLFELIDLFLDQEAFAKPGELKQQILNQVRVDQALFRELKQDYGNFRIENLTHISAPARQKLWVTIAQLNVSLDCSVQDQLANLLSKWYDDYLKKYYYRSVEYGDAAKDIFIHCLKKYNPHVSLLAGWENFSSINKYVRASMKVVSARVFAPSGDIYYVLKDMERLETEQGQAGLEVTEDDIDRQLLLLGHTPRKVEKARLYPANNGAKKVEYNDKIKLNPLFFGVVVCCVLLAVYFVNGSVPSDFGWMTMALPFFGQLSLRDARERKPDTNSDDLHECRKAIRGLAQQGNFEINIKNDKNIFRKLHGQYSLEIIEQSLRTIYAQQPPRIPKELNKIHLFLMQHGWLEQSDVETSLKELPPLERSSDKVFEVIIGKIKNKHSKAAPGRRIYMFDSKQIRTIHNRGPELFEGQLGLWPYFDQLAAAGLTLSGWIIFDVFKSGAQLPEIRDCLALLGWPEALPESKRFGRKAVEKILLKHRPAPEIRELIIELRGLDGISPMKIGYIIGSHLTKKEIKKFFIRQSGNSDLSERKIADLIRDKREHKELLRKKEVVKSAGIFVEQLAQERLIPAANGLGAEILKIGKNKNITRHNLEMFLRLIELGEITSDNLQEYLANYTSAQDRFEMVGDLNWYYALSNPLLRRGPKATPSGKKPGQAKQSLIRLHHKPELWLLLRLLFEEARFFSDDPDNDPTLISDWKEALLSPVNVLKLELAQAYTGRLPLNKIQERLAIVMPELEGFYDQISIVATVAAQSFSGKFLAGFEQATQLPLSRFADLQSAAEKSSLRFAKILIRKGAWITSLPEYHQNLILIVFANLLQNNLNEDGIINSNLLRNFRNYLYDPPQGNFNRSLQTLVQAVSDILGFPQYDGHLGEPWFYFMLLSKKYEPHVIKLALRVARNKEITVLKPIPPGSDIEGFDADADLQLLETRIKDIRSIWSQSGRTGLIRFLQEKLAQNEKMQLSQLLLSLNDPSILNPEDFRGQEKAWFDIILLQQKLRILDSKLLFALTDNLLIPHRALTEVAALKKRVIENAKQKLPYAIRDMQKKGWLRGEIRSPQAVNDLRKELADAYDTLVIDAVIAWYLVDSEVDGRVNDYIKRVWKCCGWDKDRIRNKMRRVLYTDQNEETIILQLLSMLPDDFQPALSGKQCRKIARQGWRRFSGKRDIWKYVHENYLDPVTREPLSSEILTAIICSRRVSFKNTIAFRSGYQMLEWFTNANLINKVVLFDLIEQKTPKEEARIIGIMLEAISLSDGLGWSESMIKKFQAELSLEEIYKMFAMRYAGNRTGTARQSQSALRMLIDTIKEQTGGTSRKTEEGVEALPGKEPDEETESFLGDVDFGRSPAVKALSAFNRINNLIPSWEDLDKTGGDLSIRLGKILSRIMVSGGTAYLLGCLNLIDVSWPIQVLMGILAGITVHIHRIIYLFLYAKPPPDKLTKEDVQARLLRTKSIYAETMATLRYREKLPDNWQPRLKPLIEIDLAWEELADHPEYWPRGMQPDSFRRIFAKKQLGRGEPETVFILPIVSFFPLWIQRAIITHELYKSLGYGHRRASWEEVKTFFWAGFSFIGLGTVVEKAVQSSGSIFSYMLNKRMPNNCQSAPADWEVDSTLLPPDSVLNRSWHGTKPGMMKLFQFLFTPQLQLKAPFKVFRFFGGSVLGLLKIAGLIYISLPPARRFAKIVSARKLSRPERQIILKDAADARRLNLDNFRVYPRSRKNMGLIRKIISGKGFGDCEVSPKGLINVYIPDRLFFAAGKNPLDPFLSDISIWTQVMKYRQATGKLNSLASENITRSQLAEELFNTRSVTKVRASYINIKLSRQLDRESAKELLGELISALREQYQDVKKLPAGAEKAIAGHELALSLATFNDLMRIMPEFEARPVRSGGWKLLSGSNTIWFPTIGRTRRLGVYQDMLEYIGIVFDPGDLERKWQRPERNNNSAA